jgi:hypothetical protein
MMVAGNLRSDRPHSALQSRLRRGGPGLTLELAAGGLALGAGLVALIAPS